VLKLRANPSTNGRGRVANGQDFEKGVNLVFVSPGRMGPSVSPRCDGVPDELEHLDLALPDGTAVLALLMDGNALEPARIAAVCLFDRLDERGKANRIHSHRLPRRAVDARHFDFPSSLALLPPVGGFEAGLTPVVSNLAILRARRFGTLRSACVERVMRIARTFPCRLRQKVLDDRKPTSCSESKGGSVENKQVVAQHHDAFRQALAGPCRR
jgi:hypothetical protein